MRYLSRYNSSKKITENKNGINAIKWLTLAAEQGHTYSQYYLGYVLSDEDPIQSYVFFSKSFGSLIRLAREGDSFAQRRVLNMYIYGNGIQQNIDMAINWRKECDSDILLNSKMEILADNYAHGKNGFPFDRKKAVEIYKLFLDYDRDSTLVDYNISRLKNDDGHLCIENFTEFDAADTLHIDNISMFRCFKEFAYEGSLYAQESVGYLYIKGIGVTQDIITGCAWYYIAENNEKISKCEKLSNVQKQEIQNKIVDITALLN